MLENQQLYNDPRANNSQDFQPSTQNPQGAQSQSLQQQGSGTSGVTNYQEVLNDNANAGIAVPSENALQPAPEQGVTVASPDYLLLGVLLITAVFVAFMVVLFKKAKGAKNLSSSSSLGDPVARFEKADSEPVKKRTINNESKATPASSKKIGKSKPKKKKKVNKQKRGKKKKS